MKIGYLEESRAMIAFLNEKLKMESGKLLRETKIPLSLEGRADFRQGFSPLVRAGRYSRENPNNPRQGWGGGVVNNSIFQLNQLQCN